MLSIFVKMYMNKMKEAGTYYNNASNPIISSFVTFSIKVTFVYTIILLSKMFLYYYSINIVYNGV